MRVRGLVVGMLSAAMTLGAVPAVAEPHDGVAVADVVRPRDPGYAGQWGIPMTRVNQVWAATRGAGRVTIAVLDTGVSPMPDLAGRLLAGHDFVNDDEDARDDNGHGTMAAGVIAAAGDNRTGIAGVCWTCTILPVKVLGKDGSGSYDHIADGIRYAADRGAAIISLSLGGNDDSRLLRDAVAHADAEGSLVIAAAGNRGSSKPHYPAAIPAVVAVGGVTATGARYPWSNYGSDWVDVVAPGCNPAQAPSGAVTQYCGTSSATPFVAGVAGLLASTTPAPGAAAIRAALVGGAARGRVDALGALGALPVEGDTIAPAVAFGGLPARARGLVSVTGAAADQRGVARVQLYADGRLVGTDTAPPYAFRWQSAPRTGRVALELRAYDRAGNRASVRRLVTADNTTPSVRVFPHGRFVTAKAADASGIARLELVVNGRVTTRSAGYIREFRVPAGARIVQIRAVDRAGNSRLVAAKGR